MARDQLDRTARQVRIARVVHRLRKAATTAAGREYRTRCGQFFYAPQAVLTTAEADCVNCWQRRGQVELIEAGTA